MERDAKVTKYARRRSKSSLLRSLTKRRDLLAEAEETVIELLNTHQDRLFGPSVFNLRVPELIDAVKEEAELWHEKAVFATWHTLARCDVKMHSMAQTLGEILPSDLREECKVMGQLRERQPLSEKVQSRLAEVVSLQSRRHKTLLKLIELNDHKEAEVLTRRLDCASSVKSAFVKQGPQVMRGHFGPKDVGMVSFKISNIELC